MLLARRPQGNLAARSRGTNGHHRDHSTAIADYLEEHYAGRRTLFGGETGRALARFVQNWTETVRQAGIAPLVVLDIHRPSRPQDQVRRSREEVVRDREAQLPAFRASVDPLRRSVERQDFLSGKAPAYADYIVFGAFQWARAISDFELLASDDPVRVWRGRTLDLYGGLAHRTPACGD